MQKANQFDGLVHEQTGKARFVDSGSEVGGVNTINQLSQTHAGHKKAHASHKKSHHQHAASLAQHSHHKTAAKKHHVAHGKKHHASKMAHKHKVHSTQMEEQNWRREERNASVRFIEGVRYSLWS